jgi:hypothetical protein
VLEQEITGDVVTRHALVRHLLDLLWIRLILKLTKELIYAHRRYGGLALIGVLLGGCFALSLVLAKTG